MKKTIVILSALLALVACNKETPANLNEGPIDASKVKFNISINHPDGTKAVKSDWASGDKVYLFFEGVTTGYVVTEYDGSAWTPSLEGTASLSATGKKVTAVYLPFNTDDPTYSGGWSFETKYSYYMTAEGVEYTVTTDPDTDISTLSATLDMSAPDGFVQFLLADASPVDGKYVLIQENVTPAACGVITPGGAVAQITKAAGYPMDAMTVVGEGYYFYGTVSGTVATPTFYLIEQDPTYTYAIGTQAKSFTGSFNKKSAIKFASGASGFDAQEPWVDLGLASGLKWATGNLSNGGITAPTEYGHYYAWGETTGYEYGTTHKFDGSEYFDNANPGTTYPTSFIKYNSTGATLDNDDDAAYYITSGDYRMPTTAEIQALHTECGDGEWITASGVNGRIFRGPNGLAVFFPAAGYIFDGGSISQGYDGVYWSSSQNDDFSDGAYCLDFYDDFVDPYGDGFRFYGMSVRPVQD